MPAPLQQIAQMKAQAEGKKWKDLSVAQQRGYVTQVSREYRGLSGSEKRSYLTNYGYKVENRPSSSDLNSNVYASSGTRVVLENAGLSNNVNREYEKAGISYISRRSSAMGGKIDSTGSAKSYTVTAQQSQQERQALVSKQNAIDQKQQEQQKEAEKKIIAQLESERDQTKMVARPEYQNIRQQQYNETINAIKRGDLRAVQNDTGSYSLQASPFYTQQQNNQPIYDEKYNIVGFQNKVTGVNYDKRKPMEYVDSKPQDKDTAVFRPTYIESTKNRDLGVDIANLQQYVNISEAGVEKGKKMIFQPTKELNKAGNKIQEMQQRNTDAYVKQQEEISMQYEGSILGRFSDVPLSNDINNINDKENTTISNSSSNLFSIDSNSKIQNYEKNNSKDINISNEFRNVVPSNHEERKDNILFKSFETGKDILGYGTTRTKILLAETTNTAVQHPIITAGTVAVISELPAIQSILVTGGMYGADVLSRPTTREKIGTAVGGGILLGAGAVIENIKYEEINLPKKVGSPEIPEAKYISIKDQPVIGKANGKIQVGTPEIDLTNVDFSKGISTQEYFPTKSQTKIISKNLGQVYPEAEVKKFDLINNIVSDTKTTKSKFGGKFPKETKTLNEEGVIKVKEFIKKENAETYGSFPASAQMDNARVPGDIDIQLKSTNVDDVIKKVSILSEEIPGSRVNPKKPTLIEIKGKDNEFHNTVDVHYKGEPVDAVNSNAIGDKALGHDLGQKPIKIEGIKAMPLSEQGIRKGASISILREEGLNPAPHRMKDIPDFFATQETLAKSKVIGGQSTLNKIEELKKLYPGELTSGGNIKIETPISIEEKPSVSILSSSSVSQKVSVKNNIISEEKKIISSPYQSSKIIESPTKVISIPTSIKNTSSISSLVKSSNIESPKKLLSSKQSIQKYNSTNIKSPEVKSSSISKEIESTNIKNTENKSTASFKLESANIKSPFIKKKISSSIENKKPNPSIKISQSSEIKLPKFSGKQTTEHKKGFDVFVRSKGIFSKRNTMPLAEAEAVNLGASIVGNSASATFMLKESGEATGRFLGKGNMNDFYSKDNMFIERRERRIKSQGELQEITYKGIRANRFKSVMRK